MKLKKPFLIAEISANHQGSFNIAKKLIRTAKVNGADAVKLQTYTPDTMTLRSKKKYFKINDGIWKGRFLCRFVCWYVQKIEKIAFVDYEYRQHRLNWRCNLRQISLFFPYKHSLDSVHQVQSNYGQWLI